MTQVSETVLKSLLELSDDEQAEVMERYYDSLESDQRGWNALIEDRLAAVDRGDFVSGTPDEIIEGIRRELHSHRESR